VHHSIKPKYKNTSQEELSINLEEELSEEDISLYKTKGAIFENGKV